MEPSPHSDPHPNPHLNPNPNQLLSDLFEASGERLRMRIPFACRTLSWSFLDRVQASAQASAWLRLHADTRSRGRTPPPPLFLDPVAELYLYGIDGDVVLWPDGARDVLISVQVSSK